MACYIWFTNTTPVDTGCLPVGCLSPKAFAQTTSLHFAAEMGHVEAVRLLCNNPFHNATASMRKKTGGTALHTASDTNQSATVAALLDDCTGKWFIINNGSYDILYK